MNIFELLGLSPAFDLDMAALESAYFREQRAWHPDRFIGKSAPERQQAMQRSVDINQAYDTLKDPLKRAQYLLKLQGVVVGTEQDSVKPSQELLMEIMELRENPVPEEKLCAMVEASLQQVAMDYANRDWQKMAQETLRFSYLTKAQSEMKKSA